MGALVGEGLLVPGLKDEFDLFLEERAIGGVVLQRAAEGRQLSRNIAAADAEAEAPAGEEVGLGHVLGEPQRVPGRNSVEHAAEIEFLGVLG